MSDPFRRGEILTADKLNAALAGRPLTVSGSGRLSRDAKGDVVTVDQPETIYLRLTGKTGSTPIKYSWKEVYRNSAGAWVNTDRTGTTSGDYAIELNNSDLSTTDNYVYRAERSPESGEWLFFYNQGATGSCNCSLILLTDSGVPSYCNLTYDSNHYGLVAWGNSTPNHYAINNATLSYGDGTGSLTELKKWESSNSTKPVAYAWDLPYIPSSNTPLVLRYDLKFKQDTALGFISDNCQVISTCKGNQTAYGVYDPTGTLSHGYHATGNVTSATSGNITLTSLPTTPILINANVLLSGTITYSSTNHDMPIDYECSCPGITGYGADVENWFAANVTATGNGIYTVDTGYQNIGTTGYRGRKAFTIIPKLAYVADKATVGVWPSQPVSYEPFHHQVSFQGSVELSYGFNPIFAASLTEVTRNYAPVNNTFESLVETSANVTYQMIPSGTC
jgi:hypothetical protein